MNYVLGVITVLVWAVSARAETLFVGTFNVENYGDVGRRVDGIYEREAPKPEEAKRALRHILKTGGAQIWALQEMGSRAHLEELQRDLRKDGADYPYAAWVEAEDKSRHLAVLSQVPFRKVNEHPAVPLGGGNGGVVKRGCLEVRIVTVVGEVGLYVVHLKSRLTEAKTDPEGKERRGLEAEAVRALLVETEPDPAKELYLVAGDFNDGPKSRPVRALLARGKRVLTRLVDSRDSRGETWTHHYGRDETYSRIDYILVSPGLWSVARAVTAHVVDDPEGALASDHRAVVARFELTGPQTSASTAAP